MAELKQHAFGGRSGLLAVLHGFNAVAELKRTTEDTTTRLYAAVLHGFKAVAELKTSPLNRSSGQVAFSTASKPWPN